MTVHEQAEYTQAKLVIEAVRKRIGLPRTYERRDWLRDEELLRASIHRKDELRRREAEMIAQLERWRHGEKLA